MCNFKKARVLSSFSEELLRKCSKNQNPSEKKSTLHQNLRTLNYLKKKSQQTPCTLTQDALLRQNTHTPPRLKPPPVQRSPEIAPALGAYTRNARRAAGLIKGSVRDNWPRQGGEEKGGGGGGIGRLRNAH